MLLSLDEEGHLIYFDDIVTCLQLARRVREMRETRTAPVAQKYEKKPSMAAGIKGFSTLQSFPRGMECIDPLGLG